MSSVRFEPVAMQVSKLVSLDLLLPPNVLELSREDQAPGADQSPLEPDVELFMAHYLALIRAAFQLVGAPQFARLSRLFDQIQNEYTPGGPPMSPIYDSYAMQHILGDVPTGLANESPHSVLARLLKSDPARAQLQRLAQALADSHLDLYRVTRAAGVSAELEPLRGGAAFPVRLTGPFLRTEDRILARVLPFGDGHFIAESPYLLKASEQQWLEHLERVHRAQAAGPRGGPAARPGEKRKPPSAKLSAKARARLLQQQRLAAREQAPDAVIARHLKYGSSERYWLSFIMDGYAGERRGIVYVAGIPDRPTSLPHHEDYEAEAPGPAAASPGSDVPPMAHLRQMLAEIAEREGILASAERELRLACEAQGLRRDLSGAELPLFLAYCTLGARSMQGLTALEHLERERQLDPEQQALVDSLKRGWFAVLRIDRIELDQGFEALDVLRRKKLRVTERAATRQVGGGDLLLGWLSEDEDGTFRLEGGVMHVPSLLAESVTGMARHIRDEARAALGGDFRSRAAELPPVLILGLMSLREQGPALELQNSSGDALQPATGRYEVRDRERVVEALSASFEPRHEESYAWYDTERTLLASFELKGNALLVRVNSRERLLAAKRRLERLLGNAVEPSLDLLEGELASGPLGGEQAGRAASLPQVLPEDMTQQIHALVLQRIFAVIDQPIPQFQGKSLRQLARTQSTRADAISWLREQERLLKRNPQMSSVNMRPLWHELALDYQGLDTDP